MHPKLIKEFPNRARIMTDFEYITTFIFLQVTSKAGSKAFVKTLKSLIINIDF